MLRGITVCKDCKDRGVGCHGRCEKYLKEKEALEELKKEANRQKELENDRFLYKKYGVKSHVPKPFRQNRK